MATPRTRRKRTDLLKEAASSIQLVSTSRSPNEDQDSASSGAPAASLSALEEKGSLTPDLVTEHTSDFPPESNSSNGDNGDTHSGDTGVKTGSDISDISDIVTNQAGDISDKKASDTGDIVTSNTTVTTPSPREHVTTVTTVNDNEKREGVTTVITKPFSIPEESDNFIRVQTLIKTQFNANRQVLYAFFIVNEEEVSSNYIGLPAICEATGLIKRTAIRCLDFFREHGFLTTHHDAGRRRGTLYYLSNFHVKAFQSVYDPMDVMNSRSKIFDRHTQSALKIIGVTNVTSSDTNSGVTNVTTDSVVTSVTTESSPPLNKIKKIFSLFADGFTELKSFKLTATDVQKALAYRMELHAQDEFSGDDDPLAKIESELEYLEAFAGNKEFMKGKTKGWLIACLRNGVQRPEWYISPAEKLQVMELEELKRSNTLKAQLVAEREKEEALALEEAIEEILREGEGNEIFDAAYGSLSNFAKNKQTPMFKIFIRRAVRAQLLGEEVKTSLQETPPRTEGSSGDRDFENMMSQGPGNDLFEQCLQYMTIDRRNEVMQNPHSEQSRRRMRAAYVAVAPARD